MRLEHRNPQAGRPYVRSDKYLLVSRAVLDLLPQSGPGLTAEALVDRLMHALPIELFPTSASIRWFMTAVRLDLEARGLIQRVGPRKPAHYVGLPGGSVRTETPRQAILIPDWSGPDHPDFPRRRVG